MSRSPLIPPGAVILRSYAELEAEANAFFGDYYDELMIVGPSGVGKSEAFRPRCKEHPEKCHYLEGNTKPLATYMECYWHIHKFLILDDAEGLLVSENGKHSRAPTSPSTRSINTSSGCRPPKTWNAMGCRPISQPRASAHS